MAADRLTRVLCAGDLSGSVECTEAAISAAEAAGVEAIALVGDIGLAGSPDTLRPVLKAMARSPISIYWVPGAGDAPIARYLREAANIETVAPTLRGLHGGIAFARGGHVVVAGFGGEVSDDPDAPRDESDRLTYPRWEPEYRLKILHELDEHQFMLMFATAPLHPNLGEGGAEVLTELIGTHRPRLAVVGGEQGTCMIGRSLVVAPGSVRDGSYAIADLSSHEVTREQLQAGARAS